MSSLIRLIAAGACVLVALGFGGFVSDETSGASKVQVARLGGDDSLQVVPSPANEAQRERRQTKLRELVDDANDVLLSPFTGVVHSNNPWLIRGVPTALAMLVYGVGLALLANYLPRQRRPDPDWRVA